MEHPLKGPARWLVLPGLSAAAGALAGLAVSVLALRSEPAQLAALGAALAAASGLATALSVRSWLGYLLAPPLGVLGVAASRLSDESAGLGPILQGILAHPQTLLMIAMLTAPVSALHTLRMRRPDAWAGVGAGFYALAGLAAAFVDFSARGRWDVAGSLLCVAVCVGSGSALEAALRMSRRAGA